MTSPEAFIRGSLNVFSLNVISFTSSLIQRHRGYQSCRLIFTHFAKTLFIFYFEYITVLQGIPSLSCNLQTLCQNIFLFCSIYKYVCLLCKLFKLFTTQTTHRSGRWLSHIRWVSLTDTSQRVVIACLGVCLSAIEPSTLPCLRDLQIHRAFA